MQRWLESEMIRLSNQKILTILIFLLGESLYVRADFPRFSLGQASNRHGESDFLKPAACSPIEACGPSCYNIAKKGRCQCESKNRGGFIHTGIAVKSHGYYSKLPHGFQVSRRSILRKLRNSTLSRMRRKTEISGSTQKDFSSRGRGSNMDIHPEIIPRELSQAS